MHEKAASSPDAARSRARAGLWAEAAGVAAWAAVILASAAVAALLARRGVDVHLDTPPLFARVRPSPILAAMLPAGVAAVVVASSRATARIAWRRLVLLAFFGSIAWAIALSLTGGVSALTAPLTTRFDYLVNVDRVASLATLIDTYPESLGRYTTHVRGHPPGFLAVLVLLDRAGLGGPWLPAALVIAAGASSAPAAMVAVRAVAGETAARWAAPFLVLAPGAIWVATSADGLYLGMSAWAVALGVVGLTGSGRHAVAVAAAGGLLFGLALHFSYGVAPLGAVVLAVAATRRPVRQAVASLLAFAGGALAATAVFVALGFWWFEGLRATLPWYEKGAARLRPQAYFLLANPAAFAVSLGPAAAAGLARLRGRSWTVVGGALVAVAAANLSGLSRGEVERIWLPFMPWILAAAWVLHADSRRHTRTWLAAQAAWAIAVEVALRTPW